MCSKVSDTTADRLFRGGRAVTLVLSFQMIYQLALMLLTLCLRPSKVQM